MSSEYYVFDDEGKDNAARRALFNAFIGVVSPDVCDKETMNLDLNQDRHFGGFRKSAGIWYDASGAVKCWDRRLVFWFRAKSGRYLPFFDESNRLVTFNGEPLQEAAVCTLETVLRNSANYSIGFLLLPKYKKKQEHCISKANSWLVIGSFRFPECKHAGSVTKIVNCNTNLASIQMLLEQNPSQKKSACSTRRVSPRAGDLKPSIQNKRRNIDSDGVAVNKKPVLMDIESDNESEIHNVLKVSESEDSDKPKMFYDDDSLEKNNVMTTKPSTTTTTTTTLSTSSSSSSSSSSMYMHFDDMAYQGRLDFSPESSITSSSIDEEPSKEDTDDHYYLPYDSMYDDYKDGFGLFPTTSTSRNGSPSFGSFNQGCEISPVFLNLPPPAEENLSSTEFNNNSSFYNPMLDYTAIPSPSFF